MMNYFLIIYIFNDFAILLMRIILGLIFIFHGLPKLKNLSQTKVNFKSLGFWPSWFWAPVVSILEFFGGLMILCGFYIQIPIILLIIQFVVILIWKAINFKNHKFVGEIDFDLLILAALAVLLTQNSHLFALDRFLFLH